MQRNKTLKKEKLHTLAEQERHDRITLALAKDDVELLKKDVAFDQVTTSLISGFSPLELAFFATSLKCLQYFYSLSPAFFQKQYACFEWLYERASIEDIIKIVDWLRENDRYKQISTSLTPLHMDAFYGKWNTQIEQAPAAADFLSPRQVAIAYGYYISSDPLILNAFNPKEEVLTNYGRLSFTSRIAVVSNKKSAFFKDLCVQRPDLAKAIDLNAECGKSNSGHTFARALIIAEMYQDLLSICKLQAQLFRQATKDIITGSHTVSIFAFLIQSLAKQPAQLALKNLITYVIENFDANDPINLAEKIGFEFPVNEQKVNGKSSVAAVLAYLDPNLLEKILIRLLRMNTLSLPEVDLSERFLGQTIFARLIIHQCDDAINEMLSRGKVNINLGEKISCEDGTEIPIRQYLLAQSHHELHAKINEQAGVAPPIKKESIPEKVLNPSDELEEKLKFHLAKYDITPVVIQDKLTVKLKFHCSGNQINVLTALRDFLRVRKEFNPKSDNGIIQGPMTTKEKRAEITTPEKLKLKLTFLYDVFVTKDILKEFKPSQSAKPTSAVKLIIGTQTSSRIKKILTSEQQQKWQEEIPHLFCDAPEIKFTWNDDHFRISWMNDAWNIKDAKESHKNLTTIHITDAIIEKEIISRIRKKYPDILLEKVEGGLCLWVYEVEALSFKALQSEIYAGLTQHGQIEKVAVPVLQLAEPRLAEPENLPAVVDIIPETITALEIENLFKDIAGIDRQLDLIIKIKKHRCRISAKADKYKDFDFVELFSTMVTTIQTLLPGIIRSGQQPNTILFNCTRNQYDTLRANLDSLRGIFNKNKKTGSGEDSLPIADVLLSDSKQKQETKDKLKKSLSNERRDLLTTMSSLTKLTWNNLSYHLRQIKLIKTEIDNTNNDDNKSILFYAYLAHVLRVFHTIAKFQEEDSRYYSWRNIIRHGLETKSPDEFYKQIHPLLCAIYDLTFLVPCLADNTTIFIKPISNKAFEIFDAGAANYEDFLQRKVLGKEQWSSRLPVVDHYHSMLELLKNVGLPDVWKRDAYLMLQSLRGEIIVKACKDIYGALGHAGFDQEYRVFAERESQKLGYPEIDPKVASFKPN